MYYQSEVTCERCGALYFVSVYGDTPPPAQAVYMALCPSCLRFSHVGSGALVGVGACHPDAVQGIIQAADGTA